MINNSPDRAQKAHNTAAAGFERTIQSLLLKYPGDILAVCDELESILGLKAPGSAIEWQTVSLFFINSGQSHRLVNLLKSEVAKNPLFPWAHFAEAIAKANAEFPFEVGKALAEGAKEKNNLENLARSTALDSIDPSLRKSRLLRKKQIEDRHEANRRDLLGQLETIRSQGLDQEEEQALQKLLQIFPQDGQVQELWEDFRAKKAVRFLEDRGARAEQDADRESGDENVGKVEEELRDIADLIHQAMRKSWEAEGSPAWLARDFALADQWHELPEEALAFLPSGTPEDSARWLRCELLLRSRRFVDLLSELDNVDAELADKPDQIIGALYLKALALWGLGQHNLAIELMETIVTSQPTYRSATTILNTWKRVRR